VIEKLATWARERPGRPALLIRRALKRAGPSDEGTAAELYRVHLRRPLPATTLELAWWCIEAMDLGPIPDAGVTKLLQHFHQHEFGAEGPVVLPSGAVVDDPMLRNVAGKALALRALTKAHLTSDPAVRRELDEMARRGPGLHGVMERASALHGIAADAVHYPLPVARLVGELANVQRQDGSWLDADLFHVAQALLAVEHPDATRALRRGAEALATEQREDGGFGSEERSWIACRWALRLTPAPD
jgi:hypothetical protein